MLDDNDFGFPHAASLDIFNMIDNLITSLQFLKRLNLSNCKITIMENEHSSDPSYELHWKKLLDSFNKSKLVDIDFSYNQLSYKYYNEFLQSLPNYQIKNFNMSNSLIKSNNLQCKNNEDFMDSFTKLIGCNLTSLSLRGLELSVEQTSFLIE